MEIPICFRPGALESANQTQSAMSRVRLTQRQWAQTTVRERVRRLRSARGLIARHAQELAAACGASPGRAIRESLTAEVIPLLEACRFLEEQAPTLLAPRRLGWKGRPDWLWGVRSEVQRQPFGLVVIIGPGNYPLFLPGVQLLQALVAGNGVCLKPGVGGSRVARLLQRLLAEAGFPEGLLHVLPESVEAARCAVRAVPDKVLFTGSAAVGRQILGRLARDLVPSIMELSGSDAVIVRADADLELTTKALAFGLKLNAGATCIGPRRLFVERAVATELEGRLARALEAGDLERGGTYSSDDGRLAQLVEEALERGAHCVSGGPGEGGGIRLPLVLAGVPATAGLLREDVFLPVLSIVTVSDEDEAVARANDTDFALGASVFTRDEKAGRAMAGRLQFGVVTINDLIVPTADPRLPFGGARKSGCGVTRGAEGLLELTRPKVVTVTEGRFRPAFEPTRAGDEEVLLGYAEARFATGWRGRAAGLRRLARSIQTRWKQGTKDGL